MSFPAAIAKPVREPIHVLEADPDLGALLSGPRLAAARARLVAREYTAARGPWFDPRLHRAGPEHVGLLVLEGVVARELLLQDNVSAELLGPGDLLRPWQDHGPSRLLRATVRWTVVEHCRCAVLDQGFARAIAPFPEVHAMLLDRMSERGHRLALTQAISQLNGVDQRLLALLWHLGERWGRVTAEGIEVRLHLPHRVLAQLVGARRPTVSTSLATLTETGAVTRLPDGGWLLSGDPVGLPAAETRRIVRMRRPAGARRFSAAR